MPVALRPLGPSDFAQIETLARRIWPVAYGGILREAEIENILSRIYNPENLTQEFAAGHRFWGAFRNGEALGYASGYRAEEIIWIKKLYVLPQTQGQGVGRLLLEAVIEGFLPAAEARLYVNADNRAAQGFYTRQGFHKAATVPVKMGDYDFTDFVYAKQLLCAPSHFADADVP